VGLAVGGVRSFLAAFFALRNSAGKYNSSWGKTPFLAMLGCVLFTEDYGWGAYLGGMFCLPPFLNVDTQIGYLTSTL